MKTVCHHCDYVIELADVKPGYKAQCPICGSTLKKQHRDVHHLVLGFAATALISLALVALMPFLSMGAYGVVESFSLLQTAAILFGYEHSLFATLFLVSIVILPCGVIASYLVLYLPYLFSNPPKWKVLRRACLIVVFYARQWVMAEIFLVAVLVSMVKVMAMADVTFGWGFWSFFVFVLCFIFILSRVDDQVLWQHIDDSFPVSVNDNLERGIDANLSRCGRCGKVSTVGPSNTCDSCGARLFVRKPQHIQWVMAWVITSLMLYFPANLLPIMHTKQLTGDATSTIVEGVFVLWQMGSYPVALIIFFASVVLPLIKLIGLSFLCYVVVLKDKKYTSSGFTIYRLIAFFGKWSMIDVFVIAVLVALVQIQGLIEIEPGAGVMYFAGMVMASMLASHAFESKSLWDNRK